jgi:hypothetical protein
MAECRVLGPPLAGVQHTEEGASVGSAAATARVANRQATRRGALARSGGRASADQLV